MSTGRAWRRRKRGCGPDGAESPLQHPADNLDQFALRLHSCPSQPALPRLREFAVSPMLASVPCSSGFKAIPAAQPILKPTPPLPPRFLIRLGEKLLIPHHLRGRTCLQKRKRRADQSSTT